MKDLHCHLLPGIDDGSKSIEESIKILKTAEKEGVTDIMLTPHYIENTKYDCDNLKKKELFNRLVLETKREHININLYLGNEVFITENFIDLLMERKIITLNNTRYLLFEFPLSQIPYNAKNILYDLVTIGCIPVLAHPERYEEFQKNPTLAEEFVRMGVLLQGNYKSLFGKYGKDAKKVLKSYLKDGLITFLASDTHHTDDYMISKAKRKTLEIVRDKKIVEDLFENNFDKLIRDQDI